MRNRMWPLHVALLGRTVMRTLLAGLILAIGAPLAPAQVDPTTQAQQAAQQAMDAAQQANQQAMEAAQQANQQARQAAQQASQNAQQAGQAASISAVGPSLLPRLTSQRNQGRTRPR
jgi:preprotein translocase subunit SecF